MKQEIFITTGNGDSAGDKGALFGFTHEGEELFDIDGVPTTVSSFADIGISMTCTPAIGDIDGDGIAEIVIATRMGIPDNFDNYKIYVYKNTNSNGDDKPDLMWSKKIAYKNFNGIVF